MTTYHPRKDDQGKPVRLNHPRQSTAPGNWTDAELLATATPDAPMPATVGGLEISSWKLAPTGAAGWEQLAALEEFEEPPLFSVKGKAPASGAVVVEADGRVWVVSPSNQFGGYVNTFPKGKVDAKEEINLRANALKEVFEESGLRVALTGFLCDSVRSTSVTRYYLARRVGGSPAAMGWESEAVHLVPQAQLSEFVTHANDQGILEALKQRPSNEESGA
jgi:ADP-ribose pyrophosphatase YjhB (NUDIX family)